LLFDFAEKSTPHRDPKVTIVLACIQSTFIVAPGNERRRRPRPWIPLATPIVVHLSVASRGPQNIAVVDSLRALAGFLDGTLAHR
jgi:hypothetical protein